MQLQEGRSSWSVPTVATTAATSPSVPSGLSVISVSRGSVTLTWQPPAASGGAGVSGYEVQLQAVTRAAVEVLGRDWLIIYDGPSTATTFSALTAGCSYMARVAARNEAGVSGHSIALQFTTDADAPGAPPLPEAEVEATVSRCSDAHLLSSIAGGLAVPLQTLQHLKSWLCSWLCKQHVACPLTPTCSLAPASALPPQSLLLKWAPPAHDGGSPVTSYRVEMRCDPDAANGGAPDGVGPQASLALTPHFLTIYRCVPVCAAHVCSAGVLCPYLLHLALCGRPLFGTLMGCCR